MNITGKNLKTISSNICIDMVDDVVNFHNKGNILIDKQFNAQIIPHALQYEELRYLERSDFEITPFHDRDIACLPNMDTNIRRYPSAKAFSNNVIHFSLVKNILHHSFAAELGHRPYPSGGALYPIEVICAIFSNRLTDSPDTGFYHYRPLQKVLQPLKLTDAETIHDVMYRLETSAHRTPNFAFLYVIVIGKMLIKYRYRGYRYAMMEAGAMFQQSDLIAQTFGLHNKIYSGFNDHELMKFIGLDRLSFLPLVIQSFGVTHENAK